MLFAKNALYMCEEQVLGSWCELYSLVPNNYSPSSVFESYATDMWGTGVSS